MPSGGSRSHYLIIVAHQVRRTPVIGQAKGVLMGRRALTATDSFDTLRRASQELNLRLRDVAQTLVENRATS